MASGIYKIINKNNKRVYIGSSQNLKSRWKVHLYRLRHQTHHNQFLSNDFAKCGEQAFEFVVVEECEKEFLAIREQFWLNHYYDDQNQCYNLRKVAESNRGFKMSDASRRKKSAAMKGRVPKPEVLEASRQARLGAKLPPDVCAKMANYQRNRTIEHQQRLNQANADKWQVPGYREKMSQAHRRPVPSRRKKIIQLTKQGEVVGSYLGADEASAATGVNASNIREVASGKGRKKTAGGFIWKYEE